MKSYPAKSGRTAHLAGLAAEEIAARLYPGAETRAVRWRGAGGEIDLVLGLPGLIVFVEVKARRSHAAAAHALGPAQRRRLAAAAGAYLAAHAAPSDACRFDVVLVDGAGRPERIENALGFDEF